MTATEAEPARATTGVRWWPWAIPALVLLGAAFALPSKEIFEDWVYTPSDFNYYSHGPWVLVVSAVFVYLRKRGQTFPVRQGGAASILGLIVMIGSLLFHVVCCYAEVRFASGFALIAALAGWVLWIWGWPALRRFWFPIVVLVFAVPLPEIAIATISAELKFYAAAKGVAMTNLLGIPAIQPFGQGSFVILEGGKQLTVGDVCSGLRSLISLLFFGTVYVYICKVRGLGRFLLFASVFPIAIASNVVRITVTIITAHYTTPEFAAGDFHTWMGIGLFVVAFMLMFGLERGMLWIGTRWRGGAAATAAPAADARAA